MDASQFEKGAKKSTSSVKGLESTFAKAMPKITKLIAGLGTAFAGAIGGSVAGAAILANHAKEVERMSLSLGMSTESYQALTGAASRFGIEQDKVADIIKDSNEKLGEYIATGGGGFKDFMEQIAKPQGVSANDLLAMGVEDRFVKMQTLMENMNIPLSQMSFFLEGIGSDATYLIPLLSNGGKELKRIREEMEKTGQILSDSVIKNLSTFSKNLTGIKSIIGGWGNIFVSGFAGPLADLSSRLMTFLTETQAIRNAFATLGQAIGSVLGFLSDNFQRIVTYVSTAAAGLAIWAGAAGIAAIATGGLAGALGVLRVALLTSGVGAIVVIAGELVYQFMRLVEGAGGFGNAMTLLGDVAKGVWTGISGSAAAIVPALQSVWEGVKAGFLGMIEVLATQWGNLLEMMQVGAAEIARIPGFEDIGNAMGGRLMEGMARASADVASFGAAADKASENAKRLNEEAKNMDSKGWESAAAAMKRLRDAMNKPSTLPATNPNPVALPTINSGTNTVTEPGAGGAKEKAAKITKEQQALKSLTEELEKYRATVGMTSLHEEIWNQQKAAGVTANSATGISIAGMVTELDKLKQQKDFVNGVTDSLEGLFTSIITRSSTAADALKNLASSLAQMLAQRAFMGLMSSTGLGAALGPILGPIGANANGTSGWGGGLSMVGERGAELIDLPQGSKVYSHQKSMNMLGAGSNQASRVVIDLSPDLVARTLEQANQNSVKISQQSIKQSNKGLNSRINRYENDPRARG
ncbi:hypothetical protein [Cereibacter changlensis]|uniref:hypothetical protein n=1 Tax=Cereibacter changlensis TaxID=402884 RepID=UPI0040334A30